jgi:hypothetical protein
MTTFFHCHPIPGEHKPALQVSHHIGTSRDYVEVTLEIGFDLLFIGAGRDEIHQLAHVFRAAADSLDWELMKVKPEAVSA